MTTTTANLEAETGTNSTQDDSDLDDILSPTPKNTKEDTNDAEKSLRSVLDGVASTKPRVGIIDFLTAYIGLLILNKPRQILVSIMIFLLAVIVIVNLTLSNDSVGSIYRVFDTDYSDVRSKYDMTVGKIDHWCLGVSSLRA